MEGKKTKKKKTSTSGCYYDFSFTKALSAHWWSYEYLQNGAVQGKFFLQRLVQPEAQQDKCKHFSG